MTDTLAHHAEIAKRVIAGQSPGVAYADVRRATAGDIRARNSLKRQETT